MPLPQSLIDLRLPSLILRRLENVLPHIQNLLRAKQPHLPLAPKQSGRVQLALCLMDLSPSSVLLASRIVRLTHLLDGHV
jgi:hypothetical protein